MNDVPYHIGNQLVIANGDMTQSLTSASTEVNETILAAVNAAWSGSSPVGNLLIQGANIDNSVFYATISTIAISGNSGSLLVNIQDIGYGFIRILYSPTSGTGTINVYLNRKSV